MQQKKQNKQRRAKKKKKKKPQSRSSTNSGILGIIPYIAGKSELANGSPPSVSLLAFLDPLSPPHTVETVPSSGNRLGE